MKDDLIKENATKQLILIKLMNKRNKQQPILTIN